MLCDERLGHAAGLQTQVTTTSSTRSIEKRKYTSRCSNSSFPRFRSLWTGNGDASVLTELRPVDPRGSLVTAALALVYLAGLAAIVFWPSPVDKPIDGHLFHVLSALHRSGIPAWLVNYGVVEFSANIALFIPFGVLVARHVRLSSWWLTPVLSVAASAAIELAQGLFLPGRVSSLLDVIANATGGTIGALLLMRSFESRLRAVRWRDRR